MSAKVWVGRFTFVDGEPHEEGPFLRSFLRQRPDEEEDELFVLVEPTSPASREYCGQLVDAVGRMYQQDVLSITGALLRALRTANLQLVDWNRRTLREQHVGAGISCLAVRDRTAYLAQVGPSTAYYVGDGRFQRLEPGDSASGPLGLSDEIAPALLRYELSPGDLLLVASPQIDQLVDHETLRSVLLRGGDEALVELFRRARDHGELALVLLACVVEPETEEQPPPPFIEAARVEELALAEPALPSIAPPTLSPGAELEAPASGEPAPLAPPPGLTRPPVRLKGASADVRYRRATGVAAALPRIPPLFIVVAILLIGAGLLAWYLVPPLLQESKTERFNNAVRDAQVALDKALATEDPAQRRTFLRTADGALNEADRLRPSDPRLADLRTNVDAELKKLNATLTLPDLELIADVSGRVPGSVSARDLTIGGGGAYFLDRDGGRVIALTLLAPPEPFVIYQSDELAGSDLVGKPAQIAWAESIGNVIVLDDSRRLIAASPPQSGRLLPVRGADAWGSADGIAFADGDLYVLDRRGNQIWRYPPSADGFDSERNGVLPTYDLSKVTEMALGDGIFLLQEDGSIARFKDGVVQPFSQAGLDTALSSPASLTPLPALGVVLVADRGNSRIVEFGMDGTFKQQLVSPKFSDLRAIAVDEPNNLLYILAGTTLYRTALPPLP